MGRKARCKGEKQKDTESDRTEGHNGTRRENAGQLRTTSDDSNIKQNILVSSWEGLVFLDSIKKCPGFSISTQRFQASPPRFSC